MTDRHATMAVDDHFPSPLAYCACARLALTSAAAEGVVGQRESGEATHVQYSELRRRSQERVRKLDEAVGIPRPFDLNTLLDRLERHRGRPIDLHETEKTSGGPCGLWIQERERDVIAYAADTSAVHQSHIVLHEVGHMISDHPGDCMLTVGAAQELAPTVRPELIQHMFARSTYTAFEEQEAEMIACLIRLTATERRPSQLTARPLAPADAQYFSRVEQIFGG